MKSMLYSLVAFLSLTATCAIAEAEVLFLDDFNGPTLSSAWQASFPNNAPLGPTPATYLGPPSHSFQTLDGASVLQLSNTLFTLQRVGWSTSQVFTPSNFVYAARFNTENQSPTTGIDGLLELSLIDAANPSRLDVVGPFGSSGSAVRVFQTMSTIDGGYNSVGFGFLNDTWYRLELSGSLDSNISASILSDSGTVLVSYTFSHTLSAFPSGFRLGISQAMGFPNTPAPVLAAVDNVTLSTVPEPSALGLACIGAAGMLVIAIGRQSRVNPRELTVAY